MPGIGNAVDDSGPAGSRGRRAAPAFFAVLLLAAAVGGAWWLLGSRADAPPPVAPEPTAAEPSAQPVPPVVVEYAADDGVATRDAASAATPARAPSEGFLPLTIHVVGPPELCRRVPVGVVWDVDAATGRALESVLVTDEHGAAPAEVRAFVRRPSLFWADLAFPTFGHAARPIPDECGEVELPMVLAQKVFVRVVEAGGARLVEPATAYLQGAGARPPANRWHSLAVRDGLAAGLAEIGGLAVQVRVETASGRTATASLTTTDDPTVAQQLTIELPRGGGLALRLVLADGSVAGDAAVDVRRAGSLDSLSGSALRTDAGGALRLHLPAAAWRRQAELEIAIAADVGGRRHVGTVRLPAPAASPAAGDAGTLVLAPAPFLLAGQVVTASGALAGGERVRLQALLAAATKGSDAGPPAWRDVATTVSAADGAFVFYADPPADAELRVRLEHARAAPQPVQRLDRDVRLSVPRSLMPFGRRR